MSRLVIPVSLILMTYVISASQADDRVDFSRDVRPVLADTCFKCHGPDQGQRKAHLRLDTREGLFAETDGVTIVSPSQVGVSELIRRIVSEDDDERMPPPESGLKLTRAQIEMLKRWVQQGAEWNGHWAFTRPNRPALPQPTSRFHNAIDLFIGQRLANEKLKLSPSASRETLLRRVTLDLTGLPPTIEEADNFLADERPEAFQLVIDRLLASPRWGERMAWPWLNAARYADTSGYQNDGPRDMWRWRDWVIQTFNDNMPYDQFTIEQLAGDLLPNATLDQRIATAFNRNHRGNAEGGIIPEEYQVEYVVDRVDTTATVWLGLTLGCARCHDHKYDPLKQREFYEVFAFFNNVPEFGRAIKEGNSPPFIKAPTPAQSTRLAALDRELKAVEKRCQILEPKVKQALVQWETVEPKGAINFDWNVTDGMIAGFPLGNSLSVTIESDEAVKAVGEVAFDVLDGHAALNLAENSFVDGGDRAKFGYFDPFSVSAWIRSDGPNGTVVSRMTRKPRGDGWSLHLEDGRIQFNLVKRWLDDSIRVETERKFAAGGWQHVLATYDGSRVAAGIRIYVDGEAVPLTVHHDFLNQTMANDEPLRIGAGHSNFSGAISDVRIFNRDLTADEAELLATRESIDRLLEVPADKRTQRQQRKLQRWFLTTAPVQLRDPFQHRTKLRRQRRTFFETIPTVMVMQEAETPRKTHLLDRGRYDHPREEVQPSVPGIFPPLPASTSRHNRLSFARWLVGPDHPLTARVAVNQAWQTVFGIGIVRTAEDFGVQGERPSHPQLLDWLAVEFLRRGQDTKQLYRQLVSSAVYQQSSRTTGNMRVRDPDNRLLARGPRFRLSAEMIRDQALAATGLLTERFGGPSVKPYQPEGLWAEIATDTNYEQSHGEDLYRRSLYTYWKRTVAPPSMMNFDAGAREMCTVRQSRTNTPLQALTLMNEPTFVEAARVLAQRCLADERLKSDKSRLAFAFRKLTGRRLTTAEQAVLLDSLSHQRDQFGKSRDDARSLTEVGEFPMDDELDPVELAAWSTVVGLILNLDETVTRE